MKAMKRKLLRCLRSAEQDVAAVSYVVVSLSGGLVC